MSTSVPTITDRARWEVVGRFVVLRLGRVEILRGAFVGSTGAVRLDWRGTFRSLAHATAALGLTGVEPADVCACCGEPAHDRVAICDTCRIEHLPAEGVA